MTMNDDTPGDTSTWRTHWAGKRTGAHRSDEVSFLAQEAAEKLFHIRPTEGALLDFGCGAGQLLAFYARHFERVVGADFSAAMLGEARQRLADQIAAQSAQLLCSDDRDIWRALARDERFDVITAGQVAQYMTPSQIEAFTREALGRLNRGGRLVYFDVIDPRMFALLELGLLPRSPDGLWPDLPASGRRIALALLAQARSRLVRRLRGQPSREIGYTHHPALFRRLAEAYGIQVQFVGSMYYEYRYHVLFRPRAGAVANEAA